MTPEQKIMLDKLKLNGRLPAPKGVALEVINLTQREDASNHDIARLISADPGLSVRVIKAANMLLSQTSRPVVNTSDAVTVLGARALRQLVLGISLIVDYNHGPCKQFNYANFWAHSLLTGIAVRLLASRSRLAAAEEVFVLGLLGDIGQLAMATSYSAEFGLLLENKPKSLALEDFYQLEQKQFGFNQAELSAAILADMSFPLIFQKLVQDYPNPMASQITQGSREWKLMSLLHLASLMAEVSLAAPAERNALLKNLRGFAVVAEVDEQTLIEVADACLREWPEWTKLLNMGARQLPELSVLFAQAETEPETDGVEQWKNSAQIFKMRVMVVQEDSKLRATLEKLLADAGHHVTLANNAQEAIEMMEEVQPQMVVKEWSSVQQQNELFFREICRRSATRRVYLLATLEADMANQVSALLESGVDDFVMKPLVPEVFFARVRIAQKVVQLQEELAFDREQLLRFKTELSAANERLHAQALTDALTGLPNRRLAMEKLDQEWKLIQRGNRPLSCLMVDVDHFKLINDKHGHQVGDVALKWVAECLRRAAGPNDVVSRYGGEEFLVICTDTPADKAYETAERIRLQVAGHGLKLRGGQELSMTVSVGLATKTNAMQTLENLLSCADQNLYAAKAAGRNRIAASA